MTLQVINRGARAGDTTAESVYDAFGKTIDNFAELYGAVASVSTNTTLTASRSVTAVNAASGAVTITLPSAVSATDAVVKKVDSSANAVTVAPAGGQTVDGDSSVVISYQWTAVHLKSDGSNWMMI